MAPLAYDPPVVAMAVPVDTIFTAPACKACSDAEDAVLQRGPYWDFPLTKAEARERVLLIYEREIGLLEFARKSLLEDVDQLRGDVRRREKMHKDVHQLTPDVERRDKLQHSQRKSESESTVCVSASVEDVGVAFSKCPTPLRRRSGGLHCGRRFQPEGVTPALIGEVGSDATAKIVSDTKPCLDFTSQPAIASNAPPRWRDDVEEHLADAANRNADAGQRRTDAEEQLREAFAQISEAQRERSELYDLLRQLRAERDTLQDKARRRGARLSKLVPQFQRLRAAATAAANEEGSADRRFRRGVSGERRSSNAGTVVQKDAVEFEQDAHTLELRTQLEEKERTIENLRLQTKLLTVREGLDRLLIPQLKGHDSKLKAVEERCQEMKGSAAKPRGCS